MSAPDELRRAIAADLRPTRPLAPPSVRALALVPVAAAVLVSVPLLHFFRPDLTAIGAARAWGFSIAEAVAGIVIVAAALRESIPGRALGGRAIALIFAAGLVLPVLLAGATAGTFAFAPGARQAAAVGLMCFRTSATAAMPALFGAALLSARAYPLRPAVAGGLYGLGCGLIADAGLRLWCEFSAPQHALFAHGGAVVLSTIAGMLVAHVSRR